MERAVRPLQPRSGPQRKREKMSISLEVRPNAVGHWALQERRGPARVCLGYCVTASPDDSLLTRQAPVCCLISFSGLPFLQRRVLGFREAEVTCSESPS